MPLNPWRIRRARRARHTASRDLRRSRLRIRSFLLRHTIAYEGKPWTKAYRVWLARQTFEHRTQQIAFQSLVNAMEQAASRLSELDAQIVETLPEWPLAKVVTALQSLRGVATVTAATIVAEIGSMASFSSPRHLMAFLGLTPGEHSSGGTIRRRGITSAGDTLVRTSLVEAAWHCRQPAKVGPRKVTGVADASPQWARDIAWKAQVRLTARYRKLVAKGKLPQVAVTAVARELVGFIWSIARRIDDPGARALSDGPEHQSARVDGEPALA